MNQITKSKLAVLLGGLFAGVSSALVLAAPLPPDAGQVLESVQPKDLGLPSKPAPAIEVQEAIRPAMAPVPGMKIKVAAFRITGATVFPEDQLQARVAASVGKELSFPDLEQTAASISRYYRENGYFVARAYLPAQEIKDGVVEIAVLEGKIGDVGVKMSGEGRIAESAVKDMVGGTVKPGDIVKEANIERGLLLANDMAGVDIKSTLVPGASVGTSDLVVEATQTGTFAGNINYDNFGNRFTGESRLGGGISINNPIGIGDQLSLNGTTAGSGLNYVRLAYILPVGNKGTKLGAAYSDMNYELGKDFAASNAKGTAQVASLFAVHPFIRSRNFNLYGQLGYDNKELYNEGDGIVISDKSIDAFTLGVSGDARDGLGGGGLTNFSASFTSGNLDLNGHDINDPTYPEINGGYNKINYSLARLQRATDSVSFYASITGQLASNNLDSSEKFILGGASGVRAYPQGEATGDEGYLINAEVRWDMPVNTGLGNLQLVGFIDFGHIQVNNTLWDGWNSNPNRTANVYNLSGAGIGLNLTKPGDYAVRAALATKVGNNPARDLNGNDSDGTSDSSRFWLQAIKWF